MKILIALAIAWATPGVASSGADASREWFRAQQGSDGSFAGLTVVSSPFYATEMVFLYEYLGLLEARRDRVDRLMSTIWSAQNPDGGFAGYPGGKNNLDASASVYLAAFISGENPRSPRLLKLEAAITRMGGLKNAGMGSLPFYLLMGLGGESGSLDHCLPAFTTDLLLDWDDRLPWIRVMMDSIAYLLETGKVHRLSAEKTPRLTLPGKLCPTWTPHPFRKLAHPDHKYFSWLYAHLNSDATLFDYTPTTIPALMALSSTSARALVERGVATLESFQAPTADGGLLQSPGDAAVGETFLVANAALDAGLSSEDPLVRGAERFLLSVQQKDTGAFGFSRHNEHFPDTDDTANVIYFFKRLSLARGTHELDARMAQGLRWLLRHQNRDGGFGTWDRETLISSFLDEALKRSGKGNVVLSKSVVEHSARIALCLSLFRDEAPAYRAAYERVIRFLIRKQNIDGSYGGAWFVDYLFGTSMVVAALGTDADNVAAQAAIRKGLGFILDHQQPDGGFSESPASFIEGQSIPLRGASSPAQTGLVAMELLTYLTVGRSAEVARLKPALERAIDFLRSSQKPDGLWHDKTWTGVTFPKVEYSIYPFVQEAAPWDAVARSKKCSAPFG